MQALEAQSAIHTMIAVRDAVETNGPEVRERAALSKAAEAYPLKQRCGLWWLLRDVPGT